MKTLEFRNEVTQNCAKNKACGTKLIFDSSSFEKGLFKEALSSLSEMALLMPETKILDHCKVFFSPF